MFQYEIGQSLSPMRTVFVKSHYAEEILKKDSRVNEAMKIKESVMLDFAEIVPSHVLREMVPNEVELRLLNRQDLALRE